VSAPATDRPLAGVLSLVVGIAVFSVQDLIIKLISDSYPVHEAMAIRGIVALPILLALVAVTGGLPGLLSRHAPVLALRGTVMFSAYTSYYLGLAALPFAICISLYFVAPIFMTLLSALVLKEPVSRRKWAAVIVGFVGILIVLRPERDVFDPVALLPIYSGFAYAVSATIARKMGGEATAPVMAFYANGIYLAAGLIMGAALAGSVLPPGEGKSVSFLLRPWSIPAPADLALLAACGAIAAVGTTLLTQAYRLSSPSTVAPFEYTALIWSLIYGWAVWGEVPDGVAWAGIALVVTAGLYTLSQAHPEPTRAAAAAWASECSSEACRQG
jgi:drug/metabolite transporter (DMT)-like permease